MTAAAKSLVGDVVALEPLGLHRLKDFPAPESLFCAVIDGRGADSFPPPRTEIVRPTNLPAGLSRLIGREAEIQRVRQALLIDGERLVTLTGRGGVGKTSLALVSAEGLFDEYPGGVWLARLATLASPDDVLPAIESALGGERNADAPPSEAIAARLRGRGKTLVILDNVEHLLGAAVSLADLLVAVPQLSLLVTSQAALRLTAECCLPVDALNPEAAVSLVEQVARQRATLLVRDDEQLEAMREIVSLLDGLPLALELATARLSLLTPVQLRDRLRRSSDMLRDDRRDRPHRHRSLRATVQWTLDSVPDDQRELFVRLGAFAGPVELEEIEAIAGADGLDVLGALAGLLDVALVRRIESGDARVRFGLPEAVRQIASEMLDDTQDGARWREAHLVRQHELFWRARTRMSPEHVYRAAVAADLEAGAALEWAHSTHHPLTLRLAAARAAIVGGGGRLREASSLLEPLLAFPPQDPEVRGYVHLVHAWLLSGLGQNDKACDAADEALALMADADIRAAALVTRGLLHARAGRYHDAMADEARASAIARDLGAAQLAYALLMESQVRMDAGEADVGAELLAEAERLGASSDAQGTWPAHTVRGDLALLQGRPLEAVEHYARSLEIAQQQGRPLQVHLDLIGMADAMAMGGQDQAALEIAGIAEAHLTELGAQTGGEWHVQGHDRIREASERLGAAAAKRWRSRGRAVPAGTRVVRACALASAAANRGLAPPVS